MANSSIYIASQGSKLNSEFERFFVPQKRYIVNESSLAGTEIDVEANGFVFSNEVNTITTMSNHVNNVPIFNSTETTYIPAGTQVFTSSFQDGKTAKRFVNIYLSNSRTETPFVVGVFIQWSAGSFQIQNSGNSITETVTNSWVYYPWGSNQQGATTSRIRMYGGFVDALGNVTYSYEVIPVILIG